MLTPTAHPLTELAMRLLPDGPPVNGVDRMAMLKEISRDPLGLRRVLARLRGAADRQLILVIDQFEELFTLTPQILHVP
jgi:hypothetical protein